VKAIVYTQYGSPDVLAFKEIPTPTPKDNEVRVELCAASVNPLDWHFLRGTPWPLRLMTGLFKPKRTVLGCDIAGRVEAVGKDVKLFQLGDEVYSGVEVGGFADFVCAAEEKLALKPRNLSFEEAAAVPVAALTALQGLRDTGGIKPGHSVLIDGASGGVGTFAIQIAKCFGAEVTAVCSTAKMETARSLGADHVIDYTQEDFSRNGQQYDLIFAANAHRSLFAYRRALKPGGVYVMAGGGGSQILQSLFLRPVLSRIGSKKMLGLLARMKNKDLVFLNELLENGKIAPVIDRRYPLSAAADAIRYLEEGHARGKVVLTVAGN